MMLRSIFLPERIGSYYLFTQRILGLDINKTHVFGCIVKVQGSIAIIEQVAQKSIELSKEGTAEQKIIPAVQSLLAEMGKFNKVHTCLDSTLITAKELTLPFTSYEKLKGVVPFEIEPLLPFSLTQASIDFVITKEYSTKQQSDLLVVATQKQHIINHLELLAKAGIDPDIVSVDLVSVFGFLKQIPAYNSLETYLILDINNVSTKIAFVQDSQLKSIRSLTFGINQLAKKIADDLQLPNNSALEQLLRFGFEKKDDIAYKKALDNAFNSWIRQLQLTITSFAMQSRQELKTALLMGSVDAIPGMISVLNNSLGLECTLINPLLITQNPSVKSNINHINSSAQTTSISLAIPNKLVAEFNLRQFDLEKKDSNLFITRFLIGIGLALFIIVGLFAHSRMQLNKLKKEIRSSSQEVLSALTEQFPTLEEETDIEDAIASARNIIAKEEETWFAFSGPARASYLQYLLELTNRIDKQSLGFEPEAIVMSNGTMTLKARVRDYEALKLLERELRKSKLFSYVEGQKDPEFTMKILLARPRMGGL